MITITAKRGAGITSLKRLATLKKGLSPGTVDDAAGRAAARVVAGLVRDTPKKWTGNLRRAWQIHKVRNGVRLIRNDSFIMSFIERGTANGGTGYIFPKVKKFLFIPLTRFAAMNGWTPNLRYGVSYILRRFVRGIRPRWIVRKWRDKSVDIFRAEYRRTVKGILS